MRLGLLVCAGVLLTACNPQPPPEPSGRSAATPSQAVEEFGRRLKLVSTLAPPHEAARAMREHYSGLVDAELLERWTSAPALAPGRQVSSPWPDRIEVESVSNPAPASTVVTGAVVEVTSSGEAGRRPVRVELAKEGDGWLITAYEAEPPGPGLGAAGAVHVIETYYAAIRAGDFDRAYRCWGGDGPPGQSLDEFTRGYDDTASVHVETGPPSRIEPAAGSRYIDVPVTIVAQTKSGRTQRFEGAYTLRRSVVDGATAAQRRWSIYRAELREVTADPPRT